MPPLPGYPEHVSDDARAVRAAKNEDLFREVNERIKEISASDSEQPFEGLCECTDPTCREALFLVPAAYESVRADPTHFVVAPEHHDPAVERVVERAERYWVVEKFGKAADEAERLDPRSA